MSAPSDMLITWRLLRLGRWSFSAPDGFRSLAGEDPDGDLTDYGSVIIPPTPTVAQLSINGRVAVRSAPSRPSLKSGDPDDPVPMPAAKPSAVVVPLAAISVDNESDGITPIKTPQSAVSGTRSFRFCDADENEMTDLNPNRIAISRRSSIIREKWSSKVEFLLAVIGFAVDLGNVWRFPYICYRNGGGAFLIPYMVMFIFGGLPMFYMELALGQFHRSGCISIWKKICPMFKGIGFGICFIATYVACFYNSIISYAVFFFFNSFRAEVPWKTCNNTWNTDSCVDDFNNTARNSSGFLLRSPAEEFFRFHVLEVQKSNGFHDLGGIKPALAACLFLVFVVVYFALWKGPQSSGKVVWITATMPYVVLFILLIRGVTLPGAAKGVWYYITPDFARLKDTTVWIDAATQIFFSLGPGFGVLLALSSYNEFNNNCYHDALITSAINCLTSFLSGFVIFSTLGYMSELTNRDISEVAGDGGPGLIFVVYPQAISTMSYSPVWSVLFFFMLITLGIDSTFGGLEAIITGFCDEYPKLFGRKRELFVLALVIMYFLGSLSTITYGGQYVIEFLDIYGVSFSILFIVVIETTAVCWFYGVRRFSEDVRQMIGYYPSIFWRSCWFFCPIFISVIFLVALYNASFDQMTLDGYTYPVWSVALGWFLRLTSIVCIPLYVCYKLWSLPGTMFERLMAAIKPASRRRSYMIPASAVASVADPDPTSYHTLNSGGAVVAPL